MNESPEVQLARGLYGALATQLQAHYATWMAARAEVEGTETSRALFEKEDDVIQARSVLAIADAFFGKHRK